jgi:hypothetical protein
LIRKSRFPVPDVSPVKQRIKAKSFVALSIFSILPVLEPLSIQIDPLKGDFYENQTSAV